MKEAQYVGDFVRGEYHRLSCKLILKIDDNNWIWFPSATAARNAGFKPCQACSPPVLDSQKTEFPKRRFRFGTALKIVGWLLVALLIILAVVSLVVAAGYALIVGVPIITILIVALLVWLVRQHKSGR